MSKVVRLALKEPKKPLAQLSSSSSRLLCVVTDISRVTGVTVSV